MIMRERNGKSGLNARSVLSGFLVGGLVGSGIILLKAPRSGEDTRKMIRDRASDLQDRAEQTFNDTQARVGDITEQLSDKATDIKASGLKTVREVEQKAQSVASTVTSS